jgi:hypothetical protein
MKIRLLKRWGTKIKTWPRGQVIEIADQKAKELVRENIAVKYDGDYPPSKKLVTDIFKPKKVK